MRDALRKKREELERRLNSLEASLIASHALLFINDSLDEVLSLSWEGEAAALSNSMRIAGEQGATGVIVAIRRKEAASPWDDRTREEFSQLAEFHGISLVTTIRWN